MYTYKLLHLLLFATIIYTCYSKESVVTLASRRKSLEEQALNTYRTACLRLQLLANWMSVLFKLKSAWKSTTTNIMMANPNLKIEKSMRSIPILPERPKVGEDGSDCSSLKNLHVTLQTYIHFQARLVQLKAVLGSLVLKTGKTKLDDKSTSIQSRLENLDILNKTSLDIFEKLKQSSQFLTAQDHDENLKFPSVHKVIQKSPSLLAYLQEQKSNLLHQIQETSKQTKDQSRTRILFQSGYFFQNLGQVLDRILAGTYFVPT